MSDLFSIQASTFAGSIDGLILLILVIVGFWFLLAEVIFFWLIFRFRAKPDQKTQYVTGKEKHLKRWVTVPHALILVFDVLIVVAAVRVWNDVKIQIPETDQTVRVIGQQWAWVFQHPGADNQLDTPDDIFSTDSLRVQNGVTYRYELESRDVLHNFSVPVFRLKQDAIPGRRILGWFEPTQEGAFDIQCAEICGIGHGVMRGTIVVQSGADHDTWISDNTPSPEEQAAAGTPVPDAAQATEGEHLPAGSGEVAPMASSPTTSPTQ